MAECWIAHRNKKAGGLVGSDLTREPRFYGHSSDLLFLWQDIHCVENSHRWAMWRILVEAVVIIIYVRVLLFYLESITRLFELLLALIHQLV
jgi:hypothetical protein